MKSVTLYTTPFCGYRMAAKRLLADKGVIVDEVDLVADPSRRAEMIARARGGRTVPQIFVGDEHIGGFNEICELDRTGKLGPMLAGG